MAEFETVVELGLEVSDSDLRSARRTIESELGDVSVGAGGGAASRATRTDGGAGGGRRQRRMFRWARERTEHLSDIVTILGDMEDNIGQGGGGGDGLLGSFFAFRGLQSVAGGAAGGAAGSAAGSAGGSLAGIAASIGLGGSALATGGIIGSIIALRDILERGPTQSIGPSGSGDIFSMFATSQEERQLIGEQAAEQGVPMTATERALSGLDQDTIITLPQEGEDIQQTPQWLTEYRETTEAFQQAPPWLQEFIAATTTFQLPVPDPNIPEGTSPSMRRNLEQINRLPEQQRGFQDPRNRPTQTTEVNVDSGDTNVTVTADAEEAAEKAEEAAREESERQLEDLRRDVARNLNQLDRRR